jgi:hypothetical protein
MAHLSGDEGLSGRLFRQLAPREPAAQCHSSGDDPKATIAWRVKRHTIHVRRRLDDAVSANLCHVVLDVSVARSGLSAE